MPGVVRFHDPPIPLKVDSTVAAGNAVPVVADDHRLDTTEVIELQLDTDLGGVSIQTVTDQLLHGSQWVCTAGNLLDEVGTHFYRNPHTRCMPPVPGTHLPGNHAGVGGS